MRREPIAIVGSNISALVSAIFCARRGLPVVMIGSRTHFGGHFGGVVVGNARFDVGMLFFEFTSFRSEPEISISTYQDGRLGDAGRFCTAPRIGSTRRVRDRADAPPPESGPLGG